MRRQGMCSREEVRRRLEQDITGFKLLLQIFQEIIDKTSKRIKELKYLSKEIYGVELHGAKAAGEQFRMILEKGEEKFLDWARLLVEGIMLEEGRERLKKRKLETKLMLEMLKDTLVRGEEDG